MNNKKVTSLQSNVNDLLKHANTFRDILNNSIDMLVALTDFLLLDQTLSLQDFAKNCPFRQRCPE